VKVESMRLEMKRINTQVLWDLEILKCKLKKVGKVSHWKQTNSLLVFIYSKVTICGVSKEVPCFVNGGSRTTLDLHIRTPFIWSGFGLSDVLFFCHKN
jgi:hypothetical protein